MGDENTQVNQVFLSTEHIRQWKADRENIAEEMRSMDAKVATLRADLAKIDAQLRAAMPFVPDLQEWFDAEEEKQMGPEAVALTDAIKKFLTTHKGRQFSRDQIKLNLPHVGYPVAKLNANPNYFYTALKRLVARDEFVEFPAGSGQFRLK